MEGKRTQLTYAYLNSSLHHLIFPRTLLFFNQDSNHLPLEYKLYNPIKQFKVFLRQIKNIGIDAGKVNDIADDSLHA
jgi:hypothetical protein